MQKFFKRTLMVLLVAFAAFALFEVYREKPVLVDLGTVAEGEMQVTIDEEGKTRVRDIYTVSAPIDGYISRVSLDEGQFVKAGETVITSIHPLAPPFLDDRTRVELASRVKAAELAVSLAKVQLTQSKTALELARSEHDRAKTLTERRVLPISQLEKTYNTLRLRQAEVESSQAAIKLREAELASIKARLQQPDQMVTGTHGDKCCIQIKAPVSGVVLKIITKSEQAVRAGAAIAEIGDPKRLEIIVDLLSSDAARISKRSAVEITQWGGDSPLTGTVRRVDPAAFTKVSALGIEEQRVNVVIDVPNLPETMGHGFQLLTKIVVWKNANALKVPVTAIFRSGGHWSVYQVKNNIAHAVRIEIGRINNEFAQVLDGLESGAQVILFPNDKISDGSLVQQRQ